MVSKIALEEHFLCPGFEPYWAGTVRGVAPEALRHITARLSDFGDSRIETMDRAGIVTAVLSLAGPGVQIEPDRAVAIRMAARANDHLAKEISKRSDRYAGFGHLAMQDAAVVPRPALAPGPQQRWGSPAGAVRSRQRARAHVSSRALPRPP